MRKKLLILGHARHGKDTVADMITEITEYTSISSSRRLLDVFLFDTLRDKYGLSYENSEEAYEDRINHREIWYNEISNFNKDDPSRLAKLIMEDYDIYIGLRSAREVEKCIEEEVFDLIIGVYDYRKPHEDIKSNDADVFKYSDYVILNKGSLEDLYLQVLNCLSRLKITDIDRTLILSHISEERRAQIKKWGEQTHHFGRWVSIY